jgi:hypothetical protein
MRITIDVKIPNWTKWLVAGIAIGIFLSGGAVVLAGAVSVPNTFASGDTLSAAKINDNFKALQDGINGVPWSVGSNGIYYIGGSVGVGTTTPVSALHVRGGAPIGGTGTLSSSDTTVTGSGTKFTSEVHAGDVLLVGAQTAVVASVTDDATLATTAAFSPALTSSTFSFKQPVMTAEDSSGGARFFFVDAQGNAGIGSGLNVNGAIQNGGDRLWGTTSGELEAFDFKAQVNDKTWTNLLDVELGRFYHVSFEVHVLFSDYTTTTGGFTGSILGHCVAEQDDSGVSISYVEVSNQVAVRPDLTLSVSSQVVAGSNKVTLQVFQSNNQGWYSRVTSVVRLLRSSQGGPATGLGSITKH